MGTRDASCSGNTQVTSVSDALQLGIYCDSPTQVFYGDLFIDCGPEPVHFDFMDGTGATDGITDFRYTCSESVTFPVGSTSSDKQLIPIVGIGTDFSWSSDPDEACYQTTDAVAVPSAPVPTPPAASPSSVLSQTLSPTATRSVLTTTSPTDLTTDSPTVLATDSPTILATNSPTVLATNSPTVLITMTPVPVERLTSSPIMPPQLAPVATPGAVPGGGTAPALPTVREITPSTASDSGVSVGTVVGAAAGATVGVLVVAGVIVILFLRRKSDMSSTATTPWGKPPTPINAASFAGGGSTGHDYTETEGDMDHRSGATGPTYHSNSAAHREEAEVDLGHQRQAPMAVYGGQSPQMYHQLPPQQQQYHGDQQYHQQQHPYAHQPQPYTGQSQPMTHPFVPYQPQHHGGDAHTAGVTPTPTAQHFGRVVPTNAPPVDFKDQARSASYEVPITDVQPIMAEAVATPYQPAPQPPPDQQPVIDSSLMSSGTAGTGGSNRSDPDGHHLVEM
jgi:hypothetical protein